jgi:long-chain acyl-CoA synthetase
MNVKETISDNQAKVPERTIASIIDDFDRYGMHTAIQKFNPEGSTTLTYVGLADKVRTLAKGLRENGLKKGDRVVLCAPNSAAWIISCLATIYSGAIAVPVDSQQSDEVLAHIVEDSGAAWIFTDKNGAAKFTKLPHHDERRIMRLDEDHGIHSWTSILSEEDEVTGKLYAADTAIIFYTSGTTGMPKGVPLTHANIIMQLDSVVAKLKLLKANDRVLLPLPLFHVYPLNIGLLGPLRLGLPIILPQSLTGPEIMRAINDGHATVVISVPRLLRSLYQGIDTRLHKSRLVGTVFDITIGTCQIVDRLIGVILGKVIFLPFRKKFAPTLKLLTCGGGLLDEDLATKLRALGFDIVVGYGLTETAPLLALRMPSNHDLASVGQPIPQVAIKIQPLAGGDKKQKNGGEVLVKGPNVFSSYRHLRGKTKESFSRGGWFKTGDLGYFKGKNLHITGRATSTIVMEGGEKIQPDDIEDKLAKQPGIREAALLQVNSKLVALVVPDLGQVGTEGQKEAIGKALKNGTAGMASYLQISDFAITREPLERTNLGKVKRQGLQGKYEKAKASEQSEGGKEQGGSKQGGEVSAEDRALLNDPAAKACLDWLKEKFPEHKISLDTSPQLELNIDSLEWINLTLELAQQIGVELTEEAISRSGTVRDLLKEVVTGAQQGRHAASPIKRPLLFLDDSKKKYLEPLNSLQYMLMCFFYGVMLLLMRPFAVKAVGYKKLPNCPLVFTPNHASYMDAFTLATAMPFERLRNTFWAGWTGIAYGNPVFSFFSRLSHVFPIDAQNSLIVSLALGAEVLKENKNLVWFPEGKISTSDDLLEFKPGIGLLLEKSNVLVVPVYLDGTRKVLPYGAFFPRFHKIKVIFGEPVKAAQLVKEGHGESNAERIANALHDRVEALAISHNVNLKHKAMAA